MSGFEARVRLHARLNADVVPIAYCRHAQARILVREGQAEWDDGRLVLNDAIAIRHKDRHPVLAECYSSMENRAKHAVKTLALAEQAMPVVESVFGTGVTSRLNGYGEVYLRFSNEDHSVSGWIEVWDQHFTIYVDRRWGEKEDIFPSSQEDGGEDFLFFSSQEVVSIKASKVTRMGPAGCHRVEGDVSRSECEYPVTDMLGALEFELQAIHGVLQNPSSPWLVELPFPDWSAE